MDASEVCNWLTERLARCPLISYPFNEDDLPKNGIYFFYEAGEFSQHGDHLQRIVRIGTHNDGNFRKRIANHYLSKYENKKMSFDRNKPTPKDDSVFRKHIGYALLKSDSYINIWKEDLKKPEKREKVAHLRDLEKELEIEKQITCLMRNRFTFRFVEDEQWENQVKRYDIEKHLIGSVAQCRLCAPSKNWLGKHHPDDQVRNAGLWQVHHLRASPLSDSDRALINVMLDARCP